MAKEARATVLPFPDHCGEGKEAATPRTTRWSAGDRLVSSQARFQESKQVTVAFGKEVEEGRDAAGDQLGAPSGVRRSGAGEEEAKMT